MPSNSLGSKLRNVERHGVRITFCEPTSEARTEPCNLIIGVTGATFIHPYENYDVMAGQRTAALELLSEISDIDCVHCPVGGGGLLAGTAVAAKSSSRNLQVVGVEPKQADDAYASFHAGQLIRRPVDTIADGLRAVVEEPNLLIMREWVDDVVTVSEEAIVTAMRRIWEELRIIIEPSSAAP
jgi:threonine dehydratase